MAGSQLAGRVLYRRLGPRRHLMVGVVATSLFIALLGLLATDTSLWLVRAALFGVGLSVGQVLVATQVVDHAGCRERPGDLHARSASRVELRERRIARAEVDLLLGDGGDASRGADPVVVERDSQGRLNRALPLRHQRLDERAAGSIDAAAAALCGRHSGHDHGQGCDETRSRESKGDANELAVSRHLGFPPPQGSRARYGRSCRGWDNPPLRGGDEVVTRPDAAAGYQLVRWVLMSIDTALEQIEAQLQEMGQRVVSAVHGAIRALEERDQELASEVIAFDDEVDRYFLAIEHQIQALLALQTPVARDLRLLLAMLHINLLLERSADGCVTIAKLSQLVSDVEPDPALVEVLTEMGERAEEMVRVALDSFSGRDLAGAESLVELDELIDRANRRFVERLVDVMAAPEFREWGLRMVVVARTIERIGDRAVDIGEQTAYLLTAQFREFTDASHPVS